MIKKIVLVALLVFVAVIFYKKFMAGTFESFFREKKGNVDLLQKKIPDYKVNGE